MKTNEENHSVGNESEGQGNRRTLRFLCPECGGRMLREMVIEICHPTSLIDGVEVSADDFEHAVPSYIGEEEYWESGDCEGWEYSCERCGMELTYEEDGEKQIVNDPSTLAKWLLEHCPQSDEDVPETSVKGDRE